MKSFLKITFVDVLTSKYNTKSIYCSVMILIVAMTLSGCKKDLETINSFPVNESFAMELINKGIPADFAQFFAAATMKTSSPNDTTCIFLQTFPNGASREMTLKVSPNLQYTPTSDEISNTTPGSTPIYAFKYSSIVQVDGTTKIDLNYYVPQAALSKGTALPDITSGKGSTEVAGISWDEVWNKGLDWSIGSYIDYAKDMGIKVEPLGSLYALASALSDVTGALDLSKQNRAWLNELDALEQCAANPTNPLAQKDTAYSAAAVARVQAARSELKEVNAVRYLNMMTETGAGINPVTAVLSVGLKPAFLWNEQTLNNISENTIMREAKLTVISCTDPGQQFPLELNGIVEVLHKIIYISGSSIFEATVAHTLTSVKWVPYHIGYKVQEGSGSLTYEETNTERSADGKICTQKITSIGSFDIGGAIFLFNDPYSAVAGGSATGISHVSNCDGSSFDAKDYIDWLPYITGIPAKDGSWEGVRFDTTQVSSTNFITTTTKWNFSLPPTN